MASEWGRADPWGGSDLEHDDADPERGGIDTEELEWDQAEDGIADIDGLAEQVGQNLSYWYIE